MLGPCDAEISSALSTLSVKEDLVDLNMISTRHDLMSN